MEILTRMQINYFLHCFNFLFFINTHLMATTDFDLANSSYHVLHINIELIMQAEDI